MASGPTGPAMPGTDVDRISLGRIIRGGEIVVRRISSGIFTLNLRCEPFSAGLAHYGPDGWRFFTGGNGRPALLLARAALREAPDDMKLLTDSEAASVPIWRETVRRVEKLWSVADVMMT